MIYLRLAILAIQIILLIIQIKYSRMELAVPIVLLTTLQLIIKIVLDK